NLRNHHHNGSFFTKSWQFPCSSTITGRGAGHELRDPCYFLSP
ncbi:hypothetical protein PF004_g31903, partial [Phytophthora fragariae]